MAIPRVFVSSTCYDLRYIRENLKFFIKNMGFEPILSEEGSVYYDPSLNVQDACLAEVPNCQLFVLVIGGRYGNVFKKNQESIVNYEYREAIKTKIPVFALVEQQVHYEYRVYLKNKENRDVDHTKITYPGVNSTKIFEFMAEVEGKAVNNALVPFSDFNGLESYLKKQWAGLMFSFLTKDAEARRIADMLDTLTTMNNRIEFLSKQILSSVGKDIEKINALLYDYIISNAQIAGFQKSLDFRISPIDFIEKEKMDDYLIGAGVTIKDLGNEYELTSRVPGNFTTPMIITFPRIGYRSLSANYKDVRENLIVKIKENGLTARQFIESVRAQELTPKK
jgi:hypothetical protein